MAIPVETPITVIGGYLGSGKTTLVNHLLRNADGLRLAILVNEFGELPIDADLIEAEDDNIISLSGGCVCCSYGNDLMMALMDMGQMDPRPDHIILEASGVALPAAIGSSLSLLQHYALDGIVVLADAETVQEKAGDKYVGDTITRQLDDADIVLLNKVDLVSEEELENTRAWLQQRDQCGRIIETENSKVPLNIVLQVSRGSDGDSAGSDGHHTHQFDTITIAVNHPVDVALVAQKIIEPERNIMRAKGFVEDLDGVLKTIQIVGRRVEISPAPEEVQSGLVVIGLKPVLTEGLV